MLIKMEFTSEEGAKYKIMVCNRTIETTILFALNRFLNVGANILS